MCDLVKSGGGSLLQLKDDHCNKIAKRFKISRGKIRGIVEKTQPRVIVTRM